MILNVKKFKKALKEVKVKKTLGEKEKKALHNIVRVQVHGDNVILTMTSLDEPARRYAYTEDEDFGDHFNEFCYYDTLMNKIEVCRNEVISLVEGGVVGATVIACTAVEDDHMKKIENMFYEVDNLLKDNSEVYFQHFFSNERFSQIRDYIAPHVSKDETRYFMNGVCLTTFKEGEENVVRFVATDGISMSMVDTGVTWSKDMSKHGDMHLIRLESLKPAGKYTEHYLKVFRGWNMKMVLHTVEGDGYDLTTVHKAIHGQFPNYTRVIPDKPTDYIIINNKMFREAVNIKGIVKSHRMQIVKDRVNQVCDIEMEGEKETTWKGINIGFSSSLQEFSIGINYKKLLASLSEGDSTILYTDGSNHALRIEDKDGMRLIMPMQMR